METHAILMIIGTLLCLYTGWQGFIRFRARRAGMPPPAATWKRHLNGGRLMMVVLGVGAFFGLLAVLADNVRNLHTTLGTLAVWGALLMMTTGMMLASGKGKTWNLRAIHMGLGLATLGCLIGAGAAVAGLL